MISTKPEPAGAPVQPMVAAAGPYWLALEWQADPKGRCDFLHWDVQARKTGWPSPSKRAVFHIIYTNMCILYIYIYIY